MSANRMVVGRVVSMDAGRPIIATLGGKTRSVAEAELLDAALDWKKYRNDVALKRLKAAAENI